MDLKCKVLETHYDRKSRQGIVSIPEGHCADMTATIGHFRKVDPDVKEIFTVQVNHAGEDRPDDVLYRRLDDGAWVAYVIPSMIGAAENGFTGF